MRILVTGSRDWFDKGVIYEALVTHGAGVTDVTVVHGDAIGADVIAAHWAENLGWNVEAHPANWNSCGPDCDDSHKRRRTNGQLYCPRSGFIRNDEMVKSGADICLAFIRNDSAGTKMAAKLAERAGIPVHRYIQND